MKEENTTVNYKTIDIVKQRGLLEITRDLGRLLTKEEAIKGHEKYVAMSEEEINKIEWIG